METSPLAGKSVYRPWTVDEDRRLTEYIQSHAGSSWKDVPQAAGLLRSYKSCHIRWLFHLSPATEGRNLTETEEDMVVKILSGLDLRSYQKLLSELGDAWFSSFPKLFSDIAQILIDNDATQNESDDDDDQNNNKTSLDTMHISKTPGYITSKRCISLEVLEQLFDMNMEDAAKSLNAQILTDNKKKGVIQVDSSENNDTTPNDSDYDDDDQNNNKTSLDTTHISKTPGYNTSKIYFSLEVLEQHFDMNMEDAAKSLNVSRSSLKRMCRANGIEVWPCRKRKINHQQLDNPKTVNKLVQKNNNQTNQSTRTQAEIISPSGNASSSSN